MKQLELINQFREGLSEVSREVELSSAMSLYDINLICENLFCGIFKELFEFSNLRNLNEDEKKNFAIGVYPETSLKHAREKRTEARILLSEGKDPSLEKKKQKILAQEDSANHQWMLFFTKRVKKG